MNTPMVSVIMPFLNAGSGFRAAIQSILNQTYENWELLLCDDGSVDASLAVAESICDRRVNVWSDGRRLGLAARLNECIDRARGEYIARMDADDVSYPDRLRRQVEFLEKHPHIDMVGCRMLIFGENGASLGKRPVPEQHEDIVADPALGFGVAHPTWVGRAAWFRRYRYDRHALRYEDVELLYRAYRSSQFANLSDVLYGYRELRGGFQKRLKTRLGRVRYLRAVQESATQAIFFRAALTESVKAASDAALTAMSARYVMLRLREEPLTRAEDALWRSVFDAASAGAAGKKLAVVRVGK